MKRGKIALKNISSNLLLQFVVIISGFIIPKLLISTYGSDTYGLVASITQFLSFIMLLEAGIGPVIKAKLYKYIANDDRHHIKLILKDADRFFKKIGIIFIVYVLILCLVFPYINSEFDGLFSAGIIIIMAVSTLFEYFFGIVYNLYLQADKKYYVTSSVQIFCYIFNIILVVLLIHFGASIFVVKIANTVAFIIKPVFQAMYVRKKLNMNFKNEPGDYKIDNKFDGLSQHIAYIINNNTDVTVLTIFSNLSTVAVYSVYNLVGTAVKNVSGAFTNGMDSIFGDMAAKGEKKVLQRSFSIYEFIYYTITLIMFICAMILIVPFIKIYTNGITDANYAQPFFGYILIVACFFMNARVIYSNLVYSIGHFKQTNFICWVEAISNIVISVCLVIKFGLVGVAIGTLVASLIRYLYFMYYSSKVCIDRSVGVCAKWFIISMILFILFAFITNNIKFYVPTNYFNWVVYALCVLVIVSVVVVFVNVLFNYKIFKEVLVYIKEKRK